MQKRKLLLLADVDDAVIEYTNAVSCRPELLQYIQVSTGGNHKCSVCGRKACLFWTMNRPFVTDNGGKLIGPWTLVCRAHRWAPADTADDYEEPNNAKQDQTEGQEQAEDAKADSSPADAGAEADNQDDRPAGRDKTEFPHT